MQNSWIGERQFFKNFVKKGYILDKKHTLQKVLEGGRDKEGVEKEGFFPPNVLEKIYTDERLWKGNQKKNKPYFGRQYIAEKGFFIEDSVRVGKNELVSFKARRLLDDNDDTITQISMLSGVYHNKKTNKDEVHTIRSMIIRDGIVSFVQLDRETRKRKLLSLIEDGRGKVIHDISERKLDDGQFEVLESFLDLSDELGKRPPGLLEKLFPKSADQESLDIFDKKKKDPFQNQSSKVIKFPELERG